MPKESKRFINPLLRPTAEVETKQEEVPTTQLEGPTSPEKIHTSTDTFTAPSMGDVAARQIREAPSPIPQATELRPSARNPVTYPSTDTSMFRGEVEQPEKPQLREPVHAEREIPAEVALADESESEGVMLYTSSIAQGYRDDQAATRRGVPVDYPASSITAPAPAAQPFLSTPHSGGWTPATLPDPSPPPLTSTYTTTESGTSQTYDQHDEVVEQEHYSAPPSSRRRRGAQAFEKTHERITLWIDKRLKQAFEDLAYEQEISKTALLNEAMADLLNKYTSH